MINPFIASLFVRPRRVLGRNLLPFSAWHWAAFMAFGLPFLDDGEVKPTDLVLATWICQTRFGDDLTACDEKAVKRWGRKFDFDQELSAFRLYLSEYCTFPDRYIDEEKSGGKASAIPGPFFIVGCVLQNVRGISEAEAWNMPLCRLVSYKECVAESNGAELVSDTDMQVWEAAKHG